MRRNIYTTNGVESINSGLEYIRHELGGYFPSKESFDINYFVQIVNLNDGWMKTPNPTINSKRYELRQLLTMRFDLKGEQEVRA